MTVESSDPQLVKEIYQNLIDKPLEPKDPRYQPLYLSRGAQDPVRRLAKVIALSGVDSRQLFSGFRGSGKSTELLRLKGDLEERGYCVCYADALDYINPAQPIEITDLLILLAGAFSDTVERTIGITLDGESYWTRLLRYLTETDVKIEGFDLALFSQNLKLKATLKDVPSFRQRLRSVMDARLSELVQQVHKFFEDCKKRIDAERPQNKGVVFLFDNLEQLRGNALDEKRTVLASVEKIFSQHIDLLSIPYIHVVYSAPPWLRFAIPGLEMEILPSIVQWKNDPDHTPDNHGDECLLQVILKRFGEAGYERCFPDKELALSLVRSCGGSIRDLLRLLRESILGTEDFPIPSEAVDAAIRRLRDSFQVISTREAEWLAKIAKTRGSELPDVTPDSIFRFTLFVDTHLVLYLHTGQDWYDVHPLIRDHVLKIAQRNATDAPA